jgi:hypothetical protein
MPNDRRARIEELYHAARARPAELQVAYVRDACADDAGLRDEVLSLLAHAPVSDVAAVLAAGATVSHYRIDARLGAGGMGEVFRATDMRLNRPVAIKVSRAAFSERFRREAQVLASLSHPHICTLFDVGPDYLVMELVDGETLEDRLSRGPLPIQDVLRVGKQIADALAHAHAQDVTHRDLKPSNVMLTRSGVKLLDFGLATLGDSSMTQTGAVIGTPAYMAPEQRQGSAAGPQTDIYALGLLLYEMATGKRPLLRPDEPPVLDSLPDTLRHVVARCLAENPDDRWQSASEIGALIEWFARARELKVPAADSARSRRAMANGWLTTAAAVALAAAAWTIWTAGAKSPEQANRYFLAPPSGGTFITEDPNRGGIAISPDGRWVAYVAIVNGEAGLWVYPVDPDDGVLRQVKGPVSASRPFWSPDSRSIGVASDGWLKRIDVDTGNVEQLAPLGSAFAGGAWLGDGRIVFAEWQSPLKVVSSTGGPVTPVTVLGQAEAHRYPQWLGDDRILYHESGVGDEVRIYAISLADPARATEVPTSANRVLYTDGYLLSATGTTLVARRFNPSTFQFEGDAQRITDQIAPQGRSTASVTVSTHALIFATSARRRVLRMLDEKGTPIELFEGLPEVSNPDLSPDDRLVAAVGGERLWVFERNTPPVPRATGVFFSPVFAPDGRNLTVSTKGNHFANLFRIGVRGGPLEPVLTWPDGQYANDWSRDGLVLFTQAGAKTSPDLWVVAVGPDGTRKGDPRAYLDQPHGESWGAFSPEPSSRWVAYQSSEIGKTEVFISSFPNPSVKHRVSLDGGTYPQWDAAGRLYYVTHDDRMIRATLEIRGDLIRVVSRDPLFRLPPGDGGGEAPFFDVSSDGRSFLVNVAEPAGPFTVLTNWRARLGSP